MQSFKILFTTFHCLVSDIFEYFVRESLPGGYVSVSCDGPCENVNITIEIDEGAHYLYLKELPHGGAENENCMCKETIIGSTTCFVWECLNATSESYLELLTINIRFVSYYEKTGARVFLQNADAVFPGGIIFHLVDRSYH